MIKLNNEELDKIVKSIEHEMRNYQYWKLCKHRLYERIDILDSKMYKVSGISYNEVRIASSFSHDHKLIKYINKKEEFQKMIEWIDTKNKFVDRFLLDLEEADNEFIRVALLDRRSYDTNESVAVRLGLTESGIRYKIDTIIRNQVLKFINKDVGGEIESETNGGIRDPV